MMIELSTEEQDLLIEPVERRVEDLGPEIRHCRAHVYQPGLFT